MSTPETPYQGKDASVFLMAVVNVPGVVPVVVSTPRYCRELPAHPTAEDVHAAVGALVDDAVKGAVDIAAEVRANFRPESQPTVTEEDGLHTIWGKIPGEPASTDGSENQPGVPADGDSR